MDCHSQIAFALSQSLAKSVYSRKHKTNKNRNHRIHGKFKSVHLGRVKVHRKSHHNNNKNPPSFLSTERRAGFCWKVWIFVHNSLTTPFFPTLTTPFFPSNFEGARPESRKEFHRFLVNLCVPNLLFLPDSVACCLHPPTTLQNRFFALSHFPTTAMASASTKLPTRGLAMLDAAVHVDALDQN